MSEIVHSYYPGAQVYETTGHPLQLVIEVSSVAWEGLRAAMVRRKEPITDADRENAERVRKQTSKDYIQPRGSETSQPAGGETSGRKTLNPDDVPDE